MSAMAMPVPVMAPVIGLAVIVGLAVVAPVVVAAGMTLVPPVKPFGMDVVVGIGLVMIPVPVTVPVAVGMGTGETGQRGKRRSDHCSYTELSYERGHRLSPSL